MAYLQIMAIFAAWLALFSECHRYNRSHKIR